MGAIWLAACLKRVLFHTLNGSVKVQIIGKCSVEPRT